jgi:hypothetical protein
MPVVLILLEMNLPLIPREIGYDFVEVNRQEDGSGANE